MKISLHLDQWFRRYDRFKLWFLMRVVAFESIASNPLPSTRSVTWFFGDVARTPRIDPIFSPNRPLRILIFASFASLNDTSSKLADLVDTNE